MLLGSTLQFTICKIEYNALKRELFNALKRELELINNKYSVFK